MTERQVDLNIVDAVACEAIEEAIDLLVEADQTLVTTLRAAGSTDEAIVKLVQADRAGMLSKLVASPSFETSVDAASRRPGFIGGGTANQIGKNGERYANYIRGAIGSFTDALPPQVARYITVGGKLVARFYDVVEQSGEAVDALWEVKVGFTDGTRAFRQAAADAAYKAANPGVEVRWMFLASDVTGKVGPSQRLLTYLEEKGIKFEIRFP
ncbi:MAG TPA: hypothetical protein VN108_00150 [Marmoricola sp.]|nr:hypothetical protein [Marmoricola sp.]